MREVIATTIDTHEKIGAPPTWVLSNHDVIRHVTRYGRANTSHYWLPDVDGSEADVALGTRRARAAALLALSLPGCAYVYQGEELGLPEVEDIPPSLLQDPRWERSGRTDRGRDGCRVPLPWSGQAPPFGFSPDGAMPWLPQPMTWANLTAETQAADPASMLSLYRSALALRRGWQGELSWMEMGEQVIAFRRDELMCLVNFGPEPVALPEGAGIILASAPVSDVMPSDTAVWLRSAS